MNIVPRNLYFPHLTPIRTSTPPLFSFSPLPDDGGGGALVEEAVRAIGALAGRLSWTAYYRLVNAVLKPIPTHPNQQV